MSTTDGDSGYVIPPRLWRWAGTRRAAACFLWLVALGTGAHHIWHARNWFNDRPVFAVPMRRADGNNGHSQIDFGGQWVMGRMVVRGYGRELYHRQRQWEVCRDGFQTRWEPPAVAEEYFLPRSKRKWFKPDDDIKHDADWMLYWFMGNDPPEWSKLGGAVALPLAAPPGHPLSELALQHASASAVTPELVAALKKPAIGGPLYPPVQGFLYAPLALDDDPQRAYAVFQYLSIVMVYLAALGVKVLSRGRIWWSVASFVILMYPGCRTGMDLAQNPMMSLAILVWGWVLASRGREWAGGMVWGLFVFKPVWGMAFFLVPLLTQRWRVCVAMVGTGALLAAATLPFVGLQAWFDWLAVGKEATAVYDVNKNWIHLSRDLQGIPRRMLMNFDLPEGERLTPPVRRLAWGLWATVFVGTAALYMLRGNRRNTTGLGAAFLFLGAYMSCYRFMYYDVLLSAMVFAVLFADPRRFPQPRPIALLPTPPPAPSGPRWTGYVNSFPLTILALLILVDSVGVGLRVEATVGFGYFERVVPSGSSTGVVTPRVSGDTTTNYPLDAFLLLALWVWCGWRLWRDGDEAKSA
ncbi:MAG TPA: glycosyltransferase family 87 protein [Gemmataceae bacterium]|nr:glycosyltransferase family 87 protein [Gemmataceae bacterium]